jgi:3-isopropylmalate dehydratase small subunit
MEPFQRVTGIAVPYLVDDVNTDEITPVYRSLDPDFAALFFSRRRRRPDGSLDPDFPFNQPRYKDAAVLVAGRNFGCGSSRESAVWAMRAVGIVVVVARSFSDLYRDNCLKNGLLPVVLDPAEQAAFENEVLVAPSGATVTVDLVTQTISAPSGRIFGFEVDGAERTALLEGLDDVGISLRAVDAIADYEQRVSETSPWLQEIAGRERPAAGPSGEVRTKEAAS